MPCARRSCGIVPPGAAGRGVERRPEVAAPAPLRRAERLGGRVGRLDRGGVGEACGRAARRSSADRDGRRGGCRPRASARCRGCRSARRRRARCRSGRSGAASTAARTPVSIASLVSRGSLPVISLPLVRTPLPQSVRHGSTDCCAPYLATLKPQRVGAAARRPADQRDRSAASPCRCARFCSTKLIAARAVGQRRRVGVVVRDVLEVPVGGAVRWCRSASCSASSRCRPSAAPAGAARRASASSAKFMP